MKYSYLPTKTNLIKVKGSLALSKQGQELLEKKKTVLLKEKEKQESKVAELRQEMNQLFQEGYQALQHASVDIGMEEIRKIAGGIPLENTLDIKYKTIMGVEIPSIIYQEKSNTEILNYGFYHTTISLDETVLKFKQMKGKMIQLTELENTIHRLKKNIQKVQTRSNALKDIIIPRDKIIANEIQEVLDEREREDFVRLKIVKRKLEQ